MPTARPLPLDDKIIRIAHALDDAACPYAFGGAIALAYYAAPRGTENIDLNLFVPPDEAAKPLAHLTRLGISQGAPSEDVNQGERPKEQLELRWDHTPVQIFLAYDPFHESCRARARSVPFADESICVLSGEDIAIFKTIYDREKDRTDVREVLLSLGESFDAKYVQVWLERILGKADPRTLRFEDAVSELRSK